MRIQEQNDQQLVLMAVAGETAAFEQLMQRHYRLVHHWLRQLCTEGADAADITQEVFVLAWQKLTSYQGKGEVKSWLLGIAWNCFLQNRRKHKQGVQLQEHLYRHTDAEQEILADSTNATDLERFLGALGIDERACMVLHYCYGYSHGETGELLAIPLGTVKSHLRRSILKLREEFSLETDI